MAYREQSAPARVVLEGVAIGGHPLVVGALCVTLMVGAALLAGERSASVLLPFGFVSLLAFLRAARGMRAMSVAVEGRVVSVTEGAIQRRVEVDADATLVVEWAPDTSLLGKLPGSLAMRRARCVCHTHDERIELTSVLDGPMPQQVAEALARRLELPPPTRARVDLPSATPQLARALSFMALAWAVIAALGLVVQEAERGNTGEIEIVCAERCLFEGMECLPGGQLSARFSPGEREVVVFDARESGGRRSVRVPVLAGHRSVFECRWDASAPTPILEVR